MTLDRRRVDWQVAILLEWLANYNDTAGARVAVLAAAITRHVEAIPVTERLPVLQALRSILQPAIERMLAEVDVAACDLERLTRH